MSVHVRYMSISLFPHLPISLFYVFIVVLPLLLPSYQSFFTFFLHFISSTSIFHFLLVPFLSRFCHILIKIFTKNKVGNERYLHKPQHDLRKKTYFSSPMLFLSTSSSLPSFSISPLCLIIRNKKRWMSLSIWWMCSITSISTFLYAYFSFSSSIFSPSSFSTPQSPLPSTPCYPRTPLSSPPYSSSLPLLFGILAILRILPAGIHLMTVVFFPRYWMSLLSSSSKFNVRYSSMFFFLSLPLAFSLF